MKIYLVDGTYELFRNHFGPPSRKAPDGREIGATLGLLRSQLWNVLLKLSQMGAGVLLTTRDTNFDDSKMEPGKYVAHLALEGLHPEDAYTFASRLLEYLDIDRAKAPYVVLRDLLKQLDYHPLAIQLVLPALRETSLSLVKIKTDFAALLPKFKDDSEAGRNRSLLASLDFSLKRLSDEQRALLPRLSVFEGGAKEENLLAITEIPEGEWVKLRLALERSALLTPEVVGNYTAPFLHFHPILAPYLRNLLEAGGEALSERFAKHYYAVADSLYREDSRDPNGVRALMQLELPNLRRTLEILIESDKLDDVSNMATYIASFLVIFGLRRELDEMRQQVDKVIDGANNQNIGKLTESELMREFGLGEDERRNGNLRAATLRFTRLLERIEALSEGTLIDKESYVRCLTLTSLARCLREERQLADAEIRLREALAIINTLIKQEPANQELMKQHGIVLGELAMLQKNQGKYVLAQKVFKDGLKIDKRLGNLRNQAVSLLDLGNLAMELRNYDEAKLRFTEALSVFQTLKEPGSEAISLHYLGWVARKLKDWTGAERYYRKSLVIDERLGNSVNAAMTCNELGIITRHAGRLYEAEGWYKRALELIEKVNPGSFGQASVFNNLADLLVNEVQHSQANRVHLEEAKRYARRALAIMETLNYTQTWNTLNILAKITALEGHTEDARNYRRLEHETYAAFEGNRYHIDRQHGQLIGDIVASIKGDAQACAKVEADLPEYETKGWHISEALKRIWTGERDWHSLVEDLDAEDALLILRVLETIA